MNGCVDPSLSFSLVKLINEDGRLLPVPSDGSRPKKLLHFCQGMYRARSAYALPNKGMVTQQREVSLSFSLHSTMAQCYLFDVLPPCCVFPILPETFFLSPLAPISSIRFNPSLPFSPLSPSSLDTCNNRCKSRGPLESSTEDPCEAFGRHMFSGGGGCFIELRTLGSSMITRITMEKKRTENIFKRIFCRFSPIFFPINEYLTICLKIFEFSIKFEEISSRARSRRTKRTKGR